METITDTIQLEELDELARLMVLGNKLDGSEAPGVAAALAIEAGKLVISGALLEDTLIREALGTASRQLSLESE